MHQLLLGRVSEEARAEYFVMRLSPFIYSCSAVTVRAAASGLLDDGRDLQQ